jgi:hypothetical protein
MINKIIVTKYILPSFSTGKNLTYNMTIIRSYSIELTNGNKFLFLLATLKVYLLFGM